MASTTNRVISVPTRIAFACGAVPNGVKSTGFGYFLLFFYSQVIGLDAKLVSIALFVALLIDAISDPVVGYISDHTNTRWGRRHPFMYVAAMPVAVAYYFLWIPPAMGEPAMFAYLVTMVILTRTLLTVFEIPAFALAAELTPGYDERTSILSLRYFFGYWGGLITSVSAYIVFLPESQGGLENPAGWQNYALAAASLMLVSTLACALGTHRQIPHLIKPSLKKQPVKVQQELRDIMLNPSFRAMLLAGLMTAIAAGLTTTLNIYFNRHFWEFTSDQIGLLKMPYFLSAVIALLLAPRVAKKFGKKNAVLGLSAVSLIVTPSPYVLRLLELMPDNGSASLFYSLMLFNTVDLALIVMTHSITASMVADLVEDSETRTGRRSEGIFFAVVSFVGKSVNGLGVLIAGLVLSYVHFPEHAKPGEVSQDILNNLAFMVIPILFGFHTLAFLFLTGYRLSRRDHEANLRTLERA